MKFIHPFQFWLIFSVLPFKYQFSGVAAYCRTGLCSDKECVHVVGQHCPVYQLKFKIRQR